jgi:chromosome partitioning protein
MAKIITIAHQKGGVGKSTLAINLALCFQDQLSVALVDTDLQGSLYHIREDFPELVIIGADKLTDIQKLAYDLIIVDTPPYLSNRLSELFLYSDFILVPTKAGFFDVMAIRSTLALIRDAQLKAPNIKAGIVLNMVKPRSGITQDVAELLESMDTSLLKTRIHDRISIARSSMTSGILNGSDAKAKAELMALAEEVVEQISAEIAR